MKKGIFKPKLRFPNYNEDWETNLLENLSNRGSGHTPNKKFPEYYNGSINWISLADSDKLDNGLIQETKYKISEDGIRNSSAVLHESGSVLLSRDAGIGKSAVMAHRMAVSQHFIVWTVKKNILDSWFLYYTLQILKPEFERIAIGSTIKTIGLPYFKKLKIKTPSILEQQKIAKFLSAVDKKIDLLKQKKGLIEDYKRGIMQQLFAQELRFKKQDGSDYEDWKEKKLGDVLYEHKTKNSDGNLSEVFSVSKSKGVVNQIEHLGRSFSAKSILHYKVVNPNDVVYTKSPTKDFPFGIIKQNLSSRSGVVSPLYVVLEPLNKDIGYILHCYFGSWINTFNYLNPLVQKGAKNTMNINNDDFLNGAKLKLPVSEEEQSKIATFLSSLDKKIALVNEQFKKTQEFKKGLLQQMFV